MNKVKLAKNYDLTRDDQYFMESYEVWDTWNLHSILRDQGYVASFMEAHKLWELYSQKWGAGWLEMPEDERTIFALVKEFIEEV